MTQAVLKPHDQLTHDEFTAISKAVHEFEALWRQTRQSAIEPFLPGIGEPLRLRLLIELLRIDQEHRWERAERRLLEQYLQDWPELESQPAAIQELLDAECLTRFCLCEPNEKTSQASGGLTPNGTRFVSGLALAAGNSSEIVDPESPVASAKPLKASAIGLTPPRSPADHSMRPDFDSVPTRDELRRRFPQFADAVDLDRLRATALAEKGEASTAKAGNEATLITIKSPQVGDEIDLPPTTSFPPKSETSAVLAARRIGLLTGKQFGRYEVRRMVGSGGMGAVYEARDTQLERIVALKIPRGELVNDPVILQRFLNEARAAGAIRHPHICPIYDVGKIDGQHFITMPLV